MSPPRQPKIYHITHVDNLPAIIAEGCLVSDRTMIERGGPSRAIGMSSIKRRRIDELGVHCHAGTRVGDYVPFYFCPRSVMLFVIHCGNHPELHYREGQGFIVHLEADLQEVVRWADAEGERWAFSTANAGARYATFHSDLRRLDQLDWDAIAATNWTKVKEGKQAEFLLYGRFPFDFEERIAVRSASMEVRVRSALSAASYRRRVETRADWYY